MERYILDTKAPQSAGKESKGQCGGRAWARYHMSGKNRFQLVRAVETIKALLNKTDDPFRGLLAGGDGQSSFYFSLFTAQLGLVG